MIPVPKARQKSAPGARLLSGKLLNQIVEAIRARTPLNAAQSSAQGCRGVAGAGGAPAPAAQVKQLYQASRVYVVPAGVMAKLAADLRARMPMEGVMRASPLNVSAAGLGALLRAIDDITPAAFAASSPEGYRLPAGDSTRTASLTLEWENKLLYADMCSLSVNVDDEEYVTKETAVNVSENGSVTNTTTAGGNIRTWQIDADPESCDAPVYDSDFDSGFDYGDFIESTYDVETKPFSDVLEAAVAALAAAPAATPTADFTWPQADWQAATSPGGWTYSLGGVGCVMNISSIAGQMLATTFRWRAKNTGQCHIGLKWERRLQSDGSLVTSGILSIGRGETSGWQEPPAVSAIPAERIYVTLAGVQLGPYR